MFTRREMEIFDPHDLVVILEAAAFIRDEEDRDRHLVNHFEATTRFHEAVALTERLTEADTDDFDAAVDIVRDLY